MESLGSFANGSDWKLILTILPIAAGWFVSHTLQRRLSRKQLAIQLLGSTNTDEYWNRAMATVFNHIRENPNYDYKALASKRWNGEAFTDEEKKLYHDLKTVLNHFEFTSIAVLNKAVDEHIIRWSRKYQMLEVHRACHDFITTLQNKSGNNNLLCNYCTLVKRWKGNPDKARPR